MPAPWKAIRRGNGVYAHLTADLDMSVSYEVTYTLPPGAPHYNVSVFGERLPQREMTLEDGKAKAVETAKEWLRSALAQLD